MSSYHIYASDAGKREDPDVHVLDANSNIDIFVGSLPDKGITLKTEPSLSADFESSDTWAVWMTGLGTGLVASLSWDSPTGKTIQSFRFAFVTPLSKSPVVFSSDSGCINSSFGPPLPAGSLPAKIPVPGINTSGDTLCGGLDLTAKPSLKGTVADVFSYAGIPVSAKSLPSALSKASVTLDGNNPDDKRNALWVRPSLGFQTTLRLAFTLDAYQNLEDLFTDALPGLTMPKVSVICKKTFTQGKTAAGTITVPTGSVVFSATSGSVQAKGAPKANFSASVTFSTTRISFMFLFGENSLSGVIAWLGELIGQQQELSSTINSLLEKDSIFGKTDLRCVRLSLNTTDPNKWKLSSFGFDIEVKANFGGEANSTVTFLLSYFHSKTGGAFGMLSGNFWPGMVSSSCSC